MIRSFQNSLSGIRACQQSLGVVANNLANINTTAFKRSESTFGDLYYHLLREKRLAAAPPAGAPEPRAGQGARVLAVQTFWEQGTLLPGDRPLDWAIEGEGFFKVDLPGGSAAYTRAGDLHLDAGGRLVTAAGEYLSAGFSLGAVRPETVTVSPEGQVIALDRDGSPVVLGTVRLYRFANPDGLLKERGQLYRQTEASGPPEEGVPGAGGFGKLRQYFLEQSNTILSRDMVQLMIHQRSLQASARCLATADELQGLTVQVSL